MSRLKLMQISSSPEPLTPEQVDGFQACIDYYSSRVEKANSRHVLNTHLEKVDGGYVVKTRGYITSPTDWMHFYYLHFLRAMGIEWAAERWQARHDTMIAALQAEE